MHSALQPHTTFAPHRTPTLKGWHTLCFVLLAAVPWLNPVAGGAMTAAIPLLTGWVCIALLFAGFGAVALSRLARTAAVVLLMLAVWALLASPPWQMLVLALVMIGSAAAVGAHMANMGIPTHTLSDRRIQGYSGVHIIAISWLLAGLLNAAIGLLQYSGHTAWLDEAARIINYTAPGTLYGNLRQRNHFATLMVMALWALWFIWQGRCNWWRMALVYMAGALLAVCAALTLSRTGLVQILLLIALLLWWSWRNHHPQRIAVTLWLAGLLLAYLGTSMAVPYLSGDDTDMVARLQGADSRACISRLVLWNNVWQLILQKPWTGWGWDSLNLAHYQANYSGMRFCDLLDNAHNLPLHLALELGLPAAALACTTALWWIVHNRPWREACPQRQLMWGVLLMLATHSMLEYPLWYAPFQLALGLALGVLWGTTPRTAHPPRHMAGMPDTAPPVVSAVDAHHTTSLPASSVDAIPHAPSECTDCHTLCTHLSHSESETKHIPYTTIQPYERYGQQLLAAVMLGLLAYASFDFVRVTQIYMDPAKRLAIFRADPIGHAQRSWLYRNAVDFAVLTTTQANTHNAAEQLALARRVMRYSPEAIVVQREIECLRLLGQHAEAQRAEQHFRSVYPDAWQRWQPTNQPASQHAQPHSEYDRHVWKPAA